MKQLKLFDIEPIIPANIISKGNTYNQRKYYLYRKVKEFGLDIPYKTRTFEFPYESIIDNKYLLCLCKEFGFTVQYTIE